MSRRTQPPGPEDFTLSLSGFGFCNTPRTQTARTTTQATRRLDFQQTELDIALAEPKRQAAVIALLQQRLVLYRRTFTGPDLRVVHEDQVEGVLDELHAGSCGAHSGGGSLAHQALTQGYWWPKMVTQSEEYAKRCVRCQKQSSLIHKPAFPLKMISSPWPFVVWAFDIVGKMPKAPGGFEYMLTAPDLYTKWVEAVPLVHTKASDVQSFIWKNIITRFGVPYAILSDNGSQFVAAAVKVFYQSTVSSFITPRLPL